MNQCLVLAAFTLSAFGAASGQWEIQESHTTANLRGIHAVDSSVAWASGASGTILRTLNGGLRWEKCATPLGAEQLDFRGVWAWDENNAMVVSAGPGELSRIYKTTDGCAHWTEQIRNSEKDGFWDVLVFQPLAFQTRGFGARRGQKTGVLMGDPVHGRFDTRVMTPGRGWLIDDASCESRADESAFAASNSSVFVFGSRRYIIGTGGKGGPRILLSPLLASGDGARGCLEASVPLASGNDSSGVFSLAFRDRKHGMAVGGDFKKPNDSSGTAARTSDGGRHWIGAAIPPHGYRSAVAWYPEAKAWIAAGTDGSDISRDGGQTWQSLDDGNWNALSLPYVVGPGGRIGKLRQDAIKP
jgi:photosystem II stability/assembly factor-like uncharacterized protein